MKELSKRVHDLVDALEGPLATLSLSVLILAALILPLIFINT